jgi:hypothetical protein
MERAWAALLQYDTPEVQDFAYRILIGGIITGIAHMVGFSPTTKPLSTRRTIWYGTLHATLVGVCALLVTLEKVPLSWWPRFGLPMSIGYMIYDLFGWCFPQLDWMLIVHHIVVIFVHAPVGVLAGQTICGAGDPKWAIGVSAFVYMMELSVPPLNYRWYLTKTLNRSAFRYVTNSCILGATWLLRLGVCVWDVYSFLFTASLIERHRAAGTMNIVYVFVGAHVIIFFMSAYWFYRLMQNGLWKFLVFQPPPQEEGKKTVCCKVRLKDERF